MGLQIKEQQLTQLIVQFFIADKAQQHLSMMVVGQEAEPLIAAIQNEIVLAALVGQQLIGLFHTVTQQKPPHRIRVVLVRHSFTAQHRLHERLCPHFGFIAPFHQRIAHVVNHVDMLRCQ